ncbi:MAG: PTS sugar transporter subunit IIA [Planctomycetota bacterium]
MRLTDIIQPDCVKVPLDAHDKHAAIDELADLLVAHTPITDAQGLRDAVWQRETTRTTGIGHGIGIPHGKTATVDTLRMAVGLAPQGLDFSAIDGKPVHLILLLASPEDQTGPHIQALASVSRLLTNPDLRDAMLAASSASALYQLIADHESQTVA